MRTILTAAAITLASALPLAAEPCQSILSDFSFCPSESWDRLDLELPKGIMVWQNGDVTAKVIVEAHASGTAPDLDQIIATIKRSVRASLPDPKAVSFGDYETDDGAEADLGILAYDLDLRQGHLQVHHSVLVADQVTLQFLTSTGSDNDAANLNAHREFISTFRLTEPSMSI
ncbi:hypothetical protein [Stappia sp.]|uniref:hypothetical protein n=1 Tax=Stappia sp. TaxID=1870903 RepID=UPI003A98EEDE